MQHTQDYFDLMRNNWVQAVHLTIDAAHNDAIYVSELVDEAYGVAVSTGPGLYLWWDEDDTLAYVGRAENLHRRLSEHLDTTNPKSWAYGIYVDIEWCKVAWVNGWGAWIPECDFIAIGASTYNKQHRRIHYPDLVA